MKKIKFLTPLLIIFMILTACQKDNDLEEQIDVISQEEQIDISAVNLENAQTRRKPHPVPFHATFISTPISFLPNEDLCGLVGNVGPIGNLIQTLSGNATHMGLISGSISSCIETNPPGPPVNIFNAEFTLMAANGDYLNIVEMEEPQPFIINGGSGRFKYASGSVSGSFEIIEGVIHNQLDGRIQY